MRDLIAEATFSAGIDLGRRPSPDDVLDLLFSRSRQDPEALYLAKRLRPMIKRHLQDGPV